MKVTASKKEYKLNAAAVDEVSEDFQSFLIQLKTQKKNVILSRLTVEEILLDFMDKFGQDVGFTFIKNKFLGKPYITISVEGDRFNPLEKEDSEDLFGNWSNSLITSCDYAPSYSYENGVNIITINFAKKAMNPILRLVLAIVSALLVSLLKLVVPQEAISFIIQ